MARFATIFAGSLRAKFGYPTNVGERPRRDKYVTITLSSLITPERFGSCPAAKGARDFVRFHCESSLDPALWKLVRSGG